MVTQIAAAEVIVEVPQDHIALSGLRKRARASPEVAGVEVGKSGKQIVCKLPGVARVMPCRNRSRIRHGQAREEVVAIAALCPGAINSFLGCDQAMLVRKEEVMR